MPLAIGRVSYTGSALQLPSQRPRWMLRLSLLGFLKQGGYVVNGRFTFLSLFSFFSFQFPSSYSFFFFFFFFFFGCSFSRLMFCHFSCNY